MRHDALVVVANQPGVPDWEEFRETAIREDSYVSVTILAGARAVRVLPPMAAKLSPSSLLIPGYSDAPESDAYVGLVDLLLEAEALLPGLSGSRLHLVGPAHVKNAMERLLDGRSFAGITSDGRSNPPSSSSAAAKGSPENYVPGPVLSTAWTWPVSHGARPAPVRLEYAADDVRAARALASKALGRELQAAEFDVTRSPIRRGLFKRETVGPAVLEVTRRLTTHDFQQGQLNSDVKTLLTVRPIERVNRSRRYQGFRLQGQEGDLTDGAFLVPGMPGELSTVYLEPMEVRRKYQSESLSKSLRHVWAPDLGDIPDVRWEGFGPKIASEVNPGDAVQLDRARGNLAWVATLASGTRFAVANGPLNAHGWRLDRHAHCQIPVAGVVTGILRDAESEAVIEIRILCGSIPALSHLAAR